MKNSIKTIKTITIIILFTSCLVFAQESYTTRSTQSLPARPEKRVGESDDSFRNRTIQWETQVRRVSTDNSGVTASTSGLSARPVKRAGESDASYNARMRQWEAEIRSISSAQAAQQKDEELKRLREQLDRLSAQVLPTPRTGSYTNTDSENMLIIPSEEMKAEELLSLNEDMKVMSRILFNELNQEIKNTTKVEWEFFDGQWVANNSPLGQSITTLNSMYLQGYGALFQIKVNFPLSTPPETKEQTEKVNRENSDELWEQTKQQIYEPQVAAANSYNGTAGNIVKYDAQKIENLKTSLVKTSKYAANIRELKQDEYLIIRISGLSTLKNSVKAILNGQYFIDGTWVQKEDLPDNIKDLPDNIKLLPQPQNAIVIRIKKSDIDAFARDDFDFEAFRKKVQIFSYPLLSGNAEIMK